MDFTSYPTYPLYRTLKRTDPWQKGYDVFALQVALNELLGSTLVLDGVLGDKTQGSKEKGGGIWGAQKRLGISEDGLAGGGTQKALAMFIVDEKNTAGVPSALARGQLEHESSFRLGCYSPKRQDSTASAGWSYDAGVVQRNTAHVLAAEGFQPVHAISAYLAQTAAAYKHFEGVVPDSRRWGLAAGNWNAPAFSCFIAREEGASLVKAAEVLKPSDAARATLEAYIASATAYL